MSQQKAPIYCRPCKDNGVTTEIYWNTNIKSASGKCIPQERATNKSHSCPFNQRNPNAPKPAVQPVIPATPTGAAPSAVNTVVILEKLATIEQALKRVEQAVAGLLIAPTAANSRDEGVPEE